jgi:hypothetical protein
MPDSQASNALFHRKTLNNALRSFAFPSDIADRHQKVMPWIQSLETGALAAAKEVDLHGDFLGNIFQEVLGYRSLVASGGTAWEIHPEQSISAGGGSADAALGFFTATQGKKGSVKLNGRIIAPIELKGVKNDLDRPAPGRKESAVDQGWRYANYTPDCNWVIVSNYQEIRLYRISKTPAYYERFLLTDLKELSEFNRFYFLLCRDNFLPAVDDPQAPSRVDLLLQESSEAQEEITNKLYEEYKAVRSQLTWHFLSQPPANAIAGWEAIVIEKAQKILDRTLFIAFCEDRGLLPQKTIATAHDHRDPYSPRPIWENFKTVYRWVDQGNDNPPIPGYNGGLFKHDPVLDEQIQVADRFCAQIKELTRFDFDTEVSVEILGRIFEQSVTDLEELRAEVTGEAYDRKKGKRKTQGVFYTPAFVTNYIIEVALGGHLRRREEEILEACGLKYIPDRATRKLEKAEIQFWESYRDQVLLKTRILDPACGSGAFLIAAFDYLARQYERVNDALAAYEGGQRSLFDLNRTILTQNLYGVDLSSESVEITKLSLWLKTAEKGKPLTDLDANIKVGNSIVADPDVAARAFNWESEFAEIFADGGFDVVIGNPPYVRQELLSPIKPYLQQHYEAYDGVADLYTYFYEKGLKLLSPGGVLSYIVTNKWLRSGYGEGLRRFFSLNSVVEQIVDFGHAPIFQDADTFPCIISARKPLIQPVQPVKPMASSPVLICPVPREKLSSINLPQYVQQEGYEVPWSRFESDAWSLESPAVDELMQKIKSVGTPLKDFIGMKPLYGIKTGFNEAFLIEDEIKKEIVQENPKSTEIIKPYLRGQDIKRWNPKWQNLWIILLKSSSDYEWLWSDAGLEAEEVFANDYPAVYKYLKGFEESLRKRQDKGRYWWELRSCAYYDFFEQPKVLYQEIQFHSAYSHDMTRGFTNNKVFIIPGYDLYVLGVLNSPLIWWHNWRYLPHMKDEALTPKAELLQDLPIAPPTDSIRAESEELVSQLIEITKANQDSHRDVLNWLQLEQSVSKPGQKLEDFAQLSIQDFIKEIRARRPKPAGGLNPTAIKEIQQVYNDYAPAIQTRRAEALKLERRLSDLVNQAYGLTPEDVALMWKTAPPRMPISPPPPSSQ